MSAAATLSPATSGAVATGALEGGNVGSTVLVKLNDGFAGIDAIALGVSPDSDSISTTSAAGCEDRMTATMPAAPTPTMTATTIPIAGAATSSTITSSSA